jgi:molybdate transport system ATP-binding protein
MTGHQGSGIGGSIEARDQVDRPTLEVDTTTAAGPFRITARFTAGPGITALFGPSGSGKSVTLSTVAGLLRPQQGSITLHGVEVANAEQSVHVRTQDRLVSMVFQQAALLPHRSPLDNVALAVRREDREARRAEGADWLERVYGGQLAHARTRSLSGGEQQRVALARALAGKPRLLLLDEPFSALDLPTRTDLRVLLRELVDTHQLTALLVTHDLEDIAHLADRVVLFEPGRTTRVVDVGSDRSRLPALLGLS